MLHYFISSSLGKAQHLHQVPGVTVYHLVKESFVQARQPSGRQPAKKPRGRHGRNWSTIKRLVNITNAHSHGVQPPLDQKHTTARWASRLSAEALCRPRARLSSRLNHDVLLPPCLRAIAGSLRTWRRPHPCHDETHDHAKLGYPVSSANPAKGTSIHAADDAARASPGGTLQ